MLRCNKGAMPESYHKLCLEEVVKAKLECPLCRNTNLDDHFDDQIEHFIGEKNHNKSDDKSDNEE